MIDLIALTDISGSMRTIREAAIKGFNAFLRDQQAVPGAARLTSIQFDTYYEVRYVGKPLDEVQPWTRNDLVPRGQTALIDAACRMIIEQSNRIIADGRTTRVIVFILTDGHENASREFSQRQLRELITSKRALGWEFIFAGANIDAEQVGRDYGISPDYTFDFQTTDEGTRRAYETISNTTRGLRGACL